MSNYERSAPIQNHITNRQCQNCKFQIANVMAERVGFEPTVQFPVHSISSAASSATPAPLRIGMQLAKRKAGIGAYGCPRCFLRAAYRLLVSLAVRLGFEPAIPHSVHRQS